MALAEAEGPGARRRGRAPGRRGQLRAALRKLAAAHAVTPHLHVLLPEGMWGDEAFVELPPPKDEDVEAVVHRLVRQLARAFEDEEAGWPENGLQALQ